MSKRRLCWRLAWWESTEKKEASHLLGWEEDTGTQTSAPIESELLVKLHRSEYRRGGGLDGQIVSVKRAADRKRQSSRKIFDEEKEKYRAKNGSLRNTSTDSEGTTFVILINHASEPIRKERLSPTSKARREASRNEFMEKGAMPDRVKNFREISSREHRPKARPGFVKPIRNGQKEEQNLI